MLDPAKNFAICTLLWGYDSLAVAVDLLPGDGIKLPDPLTEGSFNLTWWEVSTYSNPADDPNVEIVRCTARVDDSLTIIRGQESTNSANHNTADKTYAILLALTKKQIDDIDDHLSSTSNPHSVTSTQVGLGNVTNVSQLPLSYLDTDILLTANSDVKVPSQKAIKTYVDAGLATKEGSIGFTPENVANKSSTVTLGVSNTLYPTQNAVKTYVDTGLALKQNSLGFTAENIANKDTDVALTANSDIKYTSQKAVKAYIDTGLSAKENTIGFTPENVANKSIVTTLGVSDTLYPSQKAVKTYVDTGLSAKENTLGFTPENVANKSIDGTLSGNSDTLYPSQKAVKTYADTKMIANAPIVAGTSKMKISYDTKGLVTSGADANLDDLGDVTISAPATDEILKFNGVYWTNGPTGTTSASAGVDFFFDNTLLTGGLNYLLRVPDTVTVTTTKIITVPAGTTVFSEGYILAAQLNGTQIDGGAWLFNTYCDVDSIDGASEIIIETLLSTVKTGTVAITGAGTSRTATTTAATPFVAGDANADQLLSSYLQTPNGTFQITAYTSTSVVTIETSAGYVNESAVGYSIQYKLFQASTGEINNVVTQLVSGIFVETSFPITATDKLAVRIYGKTTSASERTINFYYNGVSTYSHFKTPLVLRHNDIAGLQGGAANEYYHLTSAEYTGTGSGVFVRTNAPALLNPTGIVKADVGLSNVDNTSDATKNAAIATLTNKTFTSPIINIGVSGTAIDTDVTLAANLDTLLASQKAVKTYVDTGLALKQNSLGYTAEDAANKSISGLLGASNTLYPSQGAVKTYVDTGLATKENSIGFTPENVANKSTDITLGVSDTLYPSQKAVKTYVDNNAFVNPMDTAGDIIVGGVVGAPVKLGIGAVNTVLHGGTTPAYSAVVEGDITLADNVTNNVSITRHGLAPKAPNDATQYLDGSGAYSVPAGSAFGDPITTAHGGTNNASWTDGDIPVFNSSLTKMEGDNTYRRWDSGLKQMIISGFKTIVGSTINYYVSTTGSDSNDGLTIGTPKLSIDGLSGVLSLIPMIGGNLYAINFADGTYVLATTGSLGYEFRPFFSVSGNLNNRTVIQLIGNAATPANVKIQAANTSSRCFTIKGRYMLLEVDGIEFTECAGAIGVENSQLMVTNFRVINNYAGAAFNITNLSTFTIKAATGTGTGLIQQKDGQNSAAISASGASGVSISQSLTVTNSGNTNAFNVLSGSFMIWSVNGLTTSVTGSVASRGLGGMFISQGALASLRGTYNWTNLDRNSISQVINITANGQVSVPSLTAVTHNITDCRYGIVVDVGAVYVSVAATDVFNYAGATPTTANRWVVTDGSIISTNYTIPTASITYNASSGANSYLGDDRRYVRRDSANVYAASSAGVDAYVITTFPLTTALVTGMKRSFKADVDNVGACSLAVDATGTIAIKKRGNIDLENGDIKAGLITVVKYDGTFWQMQTPTASVKSLADGGTGQITASLAFAALSPLTTKADILTYSTLNTRQAVGTDGQILSADSTQPTGLKWITAAGTGDMILASIQSVTGAKTFDSGKMILAGATSGTTVLNSDAIAGASVLTLPVGTDTLVARSTIDTFSNKRINPRVITALDDATAVIDVDVTDQYQLTAIANATTFTTTGTPVNSQKIMIRLKDAGVAKALTWDAVFRVIGTTLPVITVAGKTHYIGCIYNSADSVFDVIAVGVQA